MAENSVGFHLLCKSAILLFINFVFSGWVGNIYELRRSCMSFRCFTSLCCLVCAHNTVLLYWAFRQLLVIKEVFSLFLAFYESYADVIEHLRIAHCTLAQISVGHPLTQGIEETMLIYLFNHLFAFWFRTEKSL